MDSKHDLTRPITWAFVLIGGGIDAYGLFLLMQRVFSWSS